MCSLNAAPLNTFKWEYINSVYKYDTFDLCMLTRVGRESVTNVVRSRGGSRIQKGGGVPTFRRGGFVQEFQERIQIVAGSWANQQAKKNCRQP